MQDTHPPASLGVQLEAEQLHCLSIPEIPVQRSYTSQRRAVVSLRVLPFVVRLVQRMQALRQASDASDVMFSLELSQNVHSKDSLSRHQSETVELLQGAPTSDVADIQRLLRLARPQNDFETQVGRDKECRVSSDKTLPGP